MALGQPLYTGRDTGVRLNDGGQLERAGANLSNRVMATSQAQAQFSKEERDAFLDALDAETVAYVSSAHLASQAKMIEDYNKEFGDLYKKRNGRLTMDDKIYMQTRKKEMEAKQKSMTAAQERWKTDKAQVLRDTRNYYDKKKFNEAEKEFFETGEYPISALEVNPLDAEIYFSSINLKGTESMSKPDPKTGNYMVYSASPEEASGRYWAEIHQDMAYGEGRLLKDIINRFTSLSPDKKMKILDVNGDNTISPEEERALGLEGDIRSNPIMRWGEKTFAPMMIKGDARKGSTGSSGAGGGAASKPGKFGSQSYLRPSSKSNVTYGKNTEESTQTVKKDVWRFNDPVAITDVIPIDQATVLTGPVDNLRENIPVDMEVIGYSEASDEYILLVGKKNPTLGTFIGDATTVSVPVDAMSPDLQTIEVNQDGRVVTIKDLRGNRTATPAPTTGVNLNATTRKRK